MTLAAGCSTPEGTSSPTPAAPTSVSTTPVSTPSSTPSPSPSSFGQRTLQPRSNRYVAPAREVCPSSTVRARTVGQLRTAVRAARTGTVIELAPGTYRTRLKITADGTARRPIFLCGTGRMVIDGGGRTSGPVIDVRRARYWRLLDLTVRNGSVGIRGDRATHLILQDLEITGVGGRGVWWQRDSTDNLIRETMITDTGQRESRSGQGVVAGRPYAEWCHPARCEPDESDRNVLFRSTFRRTTGSAVLAYEGTYNGVVDGNVIDGRGMVADDAWVDIHGVSWTVSDNRGRHSPRDGYRSLRIYDGSGAGNVFSGNAGADLDERESGGYLIALRPDRDARLACDNTVSDRSAPVSNRRCRR